MNLRVLFYLIIAFSIAGGVIAGVFLSGAVNIQDNLVGEGDDYLGEKTIKAGEYPSLADIKNIFLEPYSNKLGHLKYSGELGIVNKDNEVLKVLPLTEYKYHIEEDNGLIEVLLKWELVNDSSKKDYINLILDANEEAVYVREKENGEWYKSVLKKEDIESNMRSYSFYNSAVFLIPFSDIIDSFDINNVAYGENGKYKYDVNIKDDSAKKDVYRYMLTNFMAAADIFNQDFLGEAEGKLMDVDKECKSIVQNGNFIFNMFVNKEISNIELKGNHKGDCKTEEGVIYNLKQDIEFLISTAPDRIVLPDEYTEKSEEELQELLGI